MQSIFEYIIYLIACTVIIILSVFYFYVKYYSRVIPVEMEISDDCSSSGEVVNPVMILNKKSRKTTGNFASAYKNDKGPTINKSEASKDRPFQRSSYSCPKSPFSKKELEHFTTQGTGLKYDVLKDWSEKSDLDKTLEGTIPNERNSKNISEDSSSASASSAITEILDLQNGTTAKLQNEAKMLDLNQQAIESDNGWQSSSSELFSPEKERTQNLETVFNDASPANINQHSQQFSSVEQENICSSEINDEVLQATPASPNRSRVERLEREKNQNGKKSRGARKRFNRSRNKRLHSVSETTSLNDCITDENLLDMGDNDDGDLQKNLQLTNNMDCFTIHMYLEWLGNNYKSQITLNPSVNVRPLFEKILMQPEIHVMISEKINEIRSNMYLMENKTTSQLFQMVSEVVQNIIRADLNNVTRVYHATLHILDPRSCN